MISQKKALWVLAALIAVIVLGAYLIRGGTSAVKDVVSLGDEGPLPPTIPNVSVPPQLTTAAPILSPAIVSVAPQPPSAACTTQENRIAEKLRAGNYCQTDADCRVADISVCPFGCYVLHHKAVSAANLAQELKDFQKQCSSCDYDCGPAPAASEVACQGGVCVDTRF